MAFGSEIKTIIDTLNSNRNKLFNVLSTKVTHNRSVISQTKDKIGYFPVIVSDSLAYDNALEISEKIENLIATRTSFLLNDTLKHNFKNNDNTNTLSKDIVRSYVGSTNQSLTANGDIVEAVNLNNLEEAVAKKRSKFFSMFKKKKKKGKPSKNKKSGADKGEIVHKKKITDSSTNSKLIDKRNNLSPTIIETNMKIKDTSKTGDKAGDSVETYSFAIGVKSILHYVNSNEMIHGILHHKVKGGLITRLLRFTSGELSFFSDIIAGIDIERKRSYDAKFKGRNIINNLAQKESTAKYYRSLAFSDNSFKYTDLLTSSLVLSSDDVNIIKDDSRIDLNIVRHAKDLCDSLGLIMLIIVNESSDYMMVYENVEDGDFVKSTLSGLSKREKDKDKVIKSWINAAI